MRPCIKRQTSEISFTQCCVLALNWTQNNTLTTWAVMHTCHQVDIQQYNTFILSSPKQARRRHTKWNLPHIRFRFNSSMKYAQAGALVFKYYKQLPQETRWWKSLCVQTVSQVGWQVSCAIKESPPHTLTLNLQNACWSVLVKLLHSTYQWLTTGLGGSRTSTSAGTTPLNTHQNKA